MSIASATLLIRVFGMGMQIAVTSRFGLGPSMDAYFIAAAVPVLVTTVVVGTLQGAVVPVYVRVRSAGEREQASRLFSTLFNLALIAATVFTVAMFLFRHQLILASAPAADPFRRDLAVTLAPIIFPALVLTVALGVLEAVLNAEGQFGWPAYAGLLVPLVTTVVVLVAGKSLGVVTLGIGTLIGLALQGCAFVVRVRRAGIVYRPILDVHNAALALVLMAGWPLLLDFFIGQVSPLIDQMFASGLSAGSISALSYALKLLSVPTGVIFAAVGRATLPFLSRHVGAGDMPGFKATLRLYLWVVGISTALVSVPMLALAHPVVQILFQRGAFSAGDTDRTATTLIGFAVGLLPMALGFLLAGAFTALGKTRVLMYVSAFSVIANATFDYFLSQLWQSFGIALATSAFYTCNLAILLFTLRRTIGNLELLTPPPELLHLLRSVRSRDYASLLRSRTAGSK
jgi:putative peptidoglycan lipid II flippase